MLGHQVVGVIEEGENKGQRVGVAWIASACGHCQHCLAGNENLCAGFKATGRDINGGYAEYMKVRADFVHPIPDPLSDSEAAPLLCAGAVGYRALKIMQLERWTITWLDGIRRIESYCFENSAIQISLILKDFCFQQKRRRKGIRSYRWERLGRVRLMRFRLRPWMRSLTQLQFGVQSVKR